MSRLPEWNLYQRVLDDAQRYRQQGADERRAQQINRIKGKAHGNESAQEQRQGEEGNDPEARRTSGL